jgi:hypothetical protein
MDEEESLKDILTSISHHLSHLEEISYALERIADRFDAISGHIYGDEDKPAFIRTSDIGD